jgi:dTDP-4-dehydrorhamnose reductase
MASRVLVFGSTGQLARELARSEWPAGLEAVFLDRGAADLTRPKGLPASVEAQRPELVVIAAAYTNVDGAEDDEETATLVNAVSPGVIAGAAAELGVPVVLFSTDYVFDGKKCSPYVESDAVNPIGAYGRSKLAGEGMVRAANPRHLILRTSWLYSVFGRNFLRTMLRLAAEKEEVTIVSDQRGCPTAAGDLARAVCEIAPRLLEGEVEWGTYHVAGASDTTWHGLAETIFSALEASGRARPRNVPIPAASFPTRARRPADSRLESGEFRRSFGIRLRGFEEAAPALLREALDAAPTALEQTR